MRDEAVHHSVIYCLEDSIQYLTQEVSDISEYGEHGEKRSSLEVVEEKSKIEKGIAKTR